MPSLAEEDPEYAAKVAAYLAEHKMPELPWGFILARGNLVAVSTARERAARAAGILEAAPPGAGPGEFACVLHIQPEPGPDRTYEQVMAEVERRDLDKNIEESI